MFIYIKNIYFILLTTQEKAFKTHKWKKIFRYYNFHSERPIFQPLLLFPFPIYFHFHLRARKTHSLCHVWMCWSSCEVTLTRHVWKAAHFLTNVRWVMGHVLSPVPANTALLSLITQKPVSTSFSHWNFNTSLKNKIISAMSVWGTSKSS